MNIKVTTIWLLLLWPCYIPGFLKSCKGNQIDNLNRLIESRKSSNPPRPESWADAKVDALEDRRNSPVSIQKGSMQADKITTLPGQPQGVNFDQYAGYVTVDPVADRSLFYYFVESPENSAKKPLLLWLNGGPGCSSFGYGAMQELGPFRVNGDGKTLYRNEYAWNNVANVMFLESPAGVGFSYSKNSSDYTNVGDKKTAEDSYIFLLNWLERFPQYKTRDFFITGESYAGHYAPQLASYILARNNNTNQTVINLKGIAIGNAWIDDDLCSKGLFDYLWTHALNSDETNQGINKHCTFAFKDSSTAIGVPDEEQCGKYQNDAFKEMGSIDLYGIYSPPCPSEDGKSNLTVNIKNYDPCAELRVHSYLNLAEVQAALHVKATNWSGCSNVGWTDSPMTILPDIRNLTREIRVWIYSGDIDGRVPVTASRYSINNLKLAVETAWLPWYSNRQVGGYVVGYKGLVFATVRGAGHTVPSYQPERSLTMITSFLDGKMPPVVPPPS